MSTDLLAGLGVGRDELDPTTPPVWVSDRVHSDQLSGIEAAARDVVAEFAVYRIVTGVALDIVTATDLQEFRELGLQVRSDSQWKVLILFVAGQRGFLLPRCTADQVADRLRSALDDLVHDSDVLG